MKLRDPETCPVCQAYGRVIETRRRLGSKFRKRRCLSCRETWSTWEIILDPKSIHEKPAAAKPYI